MLYGVFHALDVVCGILSSAIVLYCIVGWFWPRSQLYGWLRQFLEPLLTPFRAMGRWIMLKTGIPLDFSPWLAILALRLVSRLLWRLYWRL